MCKGGVSPRHESSSSPAPYTAVDFAPWRVCLRLALPFAIGVTTMAEIINLNRARKARARAEREATADANRLLHGRTKAEKAKGAAERRLTDRRLDGARLDHDPDPPEAG